MELSNKYYSAEYFYYRSKMLLNRFLHNLWYFQLNRVILQIVYVESDHCYIKLLQELNILISLTLTNLAFANEVNMYMANNNKKAKMSYINGFIQNTKI